MSLTIPVTRAYADLAAQRVRTRWGDYGHPEDYGYDFRDYVSPYTKGAGNRDANEMIVLQDWFSHDGLTARGVDPMIQRFGRDPTIKTGQNLAVLLNRHLGVTLANVYATNAFVYIKPGDMSAAIPLGDMVRSVQAFTVHEIEIVRPRIVIALGRLTGRALAKAGVDHVELPHPAARITDDAMNDAWSQI